MTNLAEQLKFGADQAWESLSEGWRELSARASGALTRFRPTPASKASTARDEGWAPVGSWAFMAASVAALDRLRPVSSSSAEPLYDAL